MGDFTKQEVREIEAERDDLRKEVSRLREIEQAARETYALVLKSAGITHFGTSDIEVKCGAIASLDDTEETKVFLRLHAALSQTGEKRG